MITELNPMVVQPSTWYFRESIKAGNASLCKESRQNITNDPANGMRCEDITIRINYYKSIWCILNRIRHLQCIVVAGQEFKLSGKVTNSACHESEEDCRSYQTNRLDIMSDR